MYPKRCWPHAVFPPNSRVAGEVLVPPLLDIATPLGAHRCSGSTNQSHKDVPDTHAPMFGMDEAV